MAATATGADRLYLAAVGTPPPAPGVPLAEDPAWTEVGVVTRVELGTAGDEPARPDRE